MWVTALLLGLAGSLHCAGMCSPLAVAVTRLSKPVLINKALYNGGRIMMYGVMGVVAGLIGGVFDFASFQKFFSLVIGAGLIIIGISGLQSFRIPVLAPLVMRLTEGIKRMFSRLLQKKTSATVLFLGVLNGLLPCGLTYMALAYSLTANGPAEGFLYMMLFGAGTLPVMIGVPLVLWPVMKRFNVSLIRINTALLILAGVFLVARNFVHLPMNGHEPTPVEIAEPVICR